LKTGIGNAGYDIQHRYSSYGLLTTTFAGGSVISTRALTFWISAGLALYIYQSPFAATCSAALLI
jgi:hypothetical protein